MPPGMNISPRRAAAVLGLVIVALIAASLAGQAAKHFLGYTHIFGLVPRLYVDEQFSIPAWYLAGLLIVAAVLAGAIAATRGKGKGRFAWHWWSLPFILLLLSVSEPAALHELAGQPIHDRWHPGGPFHSAWVIPAAILALIVGAAYLRFLVHLPPRSRSLFLAAGGIFVTGTVGMEMVSTYYVLEIGTRQDWNHVLLVHVEAMLKMAGAGILIYALLDYVRHEFGELHARVSDAALPMGDAVQADTPTSAATSAATPASLD